MIHSDLFMCKSPFLGFEIEFRVYQRSGGLKFDISKYLSFHQLETAVDILEIQTEKEQDRFIINKLIDLTVERIPPVDAVSGGGIDSFHQWDEIGEFIYPELPVPGEQACQFFHRGVITRFYRPAVAFIRPVMNHPDMRVTGGDFIGGFAGSIGAAVVDDDYLIVIKMRRQIFQRTLDHTLYIGFFIVAGDGYGYGIRKFTLRLYNPILFLV